mmetsp:Transcript_132918/g.384292  ORF Transcript_132918/g.384292 Transcript_132918/m.384292 type:complete len:216 (-) Transcript_132918:27-674(-)
MHGLRGINNLFEGGTRSDYIIVGHPEHSLGRERTTAACYKGWDTTPIPTLPKRSIAADRLRSSGSTQVLVQKLSSTGQRPPPRERALAATAASRALPRAASSPDIRGGVDAFLQALSRPGGPPRSTTGVHVTSGVGNHLGSSGTCRHHARISQELTDLAERFRFDPDGTRRDLVASDAWRYYADYLANATRQANHRSRRVVLASACGDGSGAGFS